jgi:superfamily I DNA/RNA helicase
MIENIVKELNEQQKEAVLNPLDYCTKIAAGAGTGKTKIISKRFLKLVLDLEDSPASKILVITFTDKAANEMKERIVKELKENDIDTFGQDLWISTFHSFCIKILKKYSIEANLSPSFKIAEEQQLKDIYDNLIKFIRYGEAGLIEDYERILDGLNLEADILRIENVNKLNKIADIETVLEDIYSVIKKIKSLGINAKEFLNGTLSAVQEFSKTVENTPFKFDSKEEYARAWDEHFKKYTEECVDEAVFDRIAKEKLILDKFGKRKAVEYGMAQGFPENIREIENAEILLTKIVAAIYALYQNELEKRDLVDFDDLINKTIQIFKENAQIRSFYQNYFKQIIVDEFQDTNGAQLELIELLLNPEHANLTFVGDRKQSIYSFRFAQMENLEVLYDNVSRKYGKTYKQIDLSTNYRSTQDVLDAVNYVTENELKLTNESLSAYKNSKKNPNNVKVTVIEGFENAYEQKIAEAQAIAEEIQSIKECETVDFKDFAVLVKSHSQADIIESELKKKNIPSVKKVNTGFFNEPVIKNMTALFRLVKNREDELALVRVLKIKMSDSEIYRMKKDFDREILKIFGREELKKMNLAQKYIFLKNSVNYPYIEKIYDTVAFLNKHKSSLLQVFEKLKADITPFNCTGFEAEQAQNNLKILEKIIDDFVQNEHHISINDMLKYLEKIDRNFELPSLSLKELNAVQILTIHASKGLEFPYVFVLSISSASKTPDRTNIYFDMQYGYKPGFGIVLNKYKGKPAAKDLIYKELWQKPRDRNEALRLFYVAVSRAEKYLNILSFEPYSSVKPAEYICNLQDYLNVNNVTAPNMLSF